MPNKLNAPRDIASINRRGALSGICFCSMGLAAAGAQMLRPEKRLRIDLDGIRLSQVIPSCIDTWREEVSGGVALVNPQQAEVIKTIYTDMLGRSYLNNDGYRVMLSVAYGADQRRSFKVHYPEACYLAQGFDIISRKEDLLRTPDGAIRVMRIVATQGVVRPEPLTYWSVLGSSRVLFGISNKLSLLSYTLRGYIPSGLIFRVSSIDSNYDRAFVKQDQFVNQLLMAVTPATRVRLAGVTDFEG